MNDNYTSDTETETEAETEADRKTVTECSDFFATIFRMKYINRWALMRNSREENLSEHSAEVALIAHCLCTLGNIRHKRHLNAERAAVIGLFHDSSEIITGDMPTPVKYYNTQIRDAYREIEEGARQKLLSKLPADLQDTYSRLYEDGGGNEDDRYERCLVKAADKLSALIKCMEELKAGNREFRKACETISASVEELAEKYPEVKDFTTGFLPAYGKTLDELS